MTYVVPRRKANKTKMLRALNKQMEETEAFIRELVEEQQALQKFWATLHGKDGVEQAGQLYTEQEEVYGAILPHQVCRVYNPHA